MTFGQFILGLVTITVATVVYRWQKAVDRRLEQSRQLAELYAGYVALTMRHITAQPMVGDVNADEKASAFASMQGEETDIYILRDKIALLAPSPVVERLRSCDQAFRDWKIAFHRELDDAAEKKRIVSESQSFLRDQRHLLIEQMRADLREHRSIKLGVPSALRKRFERK